MQLFLQKYFTILCLTIITCIGLISGEDGGSTGFVLFILYGIYKAFTISMEED